MSSAPGSLAPGGLCFLHSCFTHPAAPAHRQALSKEQKNAGGTLHCVLGGSLGMKGAGPIKSTLSEQLWVNEAERDRTTD